MSHTFRYLFIGLLLASSLLGLESVQISDRTGRTIDVEILQIENSRINIRMTNGQVIWLDRSRLSEASDQMITDLAKTEDEKFVKLNDTLGLELFADNDLWDDSPNEIADRLDWPVESKTDHQSSYRYYPSPDYRILGSRPYSAALYADGDSPQSISIVFANKGDFRFSDPPSSDEIKAMENAIEDDAEKIEERLTDLLGEPERQQYGSGRGLKQLIKRWDWNHHAFLLASQDAEYVYLKIITKDSADNKGRSSRISDAALRKLSKENITTEGNGDVYISNIPMVDQGPKGYCVPATFERYLRYLQIPADMYILAMAGQTDVGGGTSLAKTIESIEGYAASQNRSMKRMEEEIEIRIIQKHIDDGLPLIWTMFSSREFNSFANSRTRERFGTNDWAQWESKTREESRNIRLIKDFYSAHACMIIGYNKATGEIAVSDSWGPSYAIRWIPAQQAEQVSQGYLYLIDY